MGNEGEARSASDETAEFVPKPSVHVWTDVVGLMLGSDG